jgi:hypothetical protein
LDYGFRMDCRPLCRSTCCVRSSKEAGILALAD